MLVNRIKTHFCSPSNEQCMSSVSAVTLKAFPLRSERTNRPLSGSLWDLSFWNQTLFSCCQSCRDSTSRSAMVESKQCIWCKKALLHSFVTPDNVHTLASSFKLTISKRANRRCMQNSPSVVCDTYCALREKVTGAACDGCRIWIFIARDNDTDPSNEMDGRQGGRLNLLYVYVGQLFKDFSTRPVAVFPCGNAATGRPQHMASSINLNVRTDFWP